MTNYVDVISKYYPGLEVSMSGDFSVYENIVLQKGDSLPTKEELDQRVLDENRLKMWRIIQEERDRRKASGVLVNGNWFHSDDTSRIQHLGLLALGASIPPGIMWKTMSGTYVEMTNTLAQQIFAAVMQRDIQVFSLAEQKRAAMNASADPMSFDWQSGWPTVFGE